MKVEPKKKHYEIVQEAFFENVNVLTRYQFTSDIIAMDFFMHKHTKYQNQTSEEQSQWCCRFEIIYPDLSIRTISYFGYSYLTIGGEGDEIFLQMLEEYHKRKG